MKAKVLGRHPGEIVAETDGHRLALDGKGETGPRPLALLLTSLGGCHASVLIHILRIMRVDWEELELQLEGHIGREEPKTFTSVHMSYQLSGIGLEDKRVRRGLELAEEYCPVSTILKRAGVSINYQLKLREASEGDETKTAVMSATPGS
ncbi:MAG: OsmC family protein [Thermoplasmata archaeon]